ncbi:hypothetical protein BGZ96_007627 [Linnemannia gamsii]|uniref:SUN domain-containing protein n=1 Tax=Linnemannia gamsii TaxID=64522 RepID=A0ABQ7KH66_9FUNG|nr:hypothetical protein BGZ96_007627 [Linnemannia gamsii]
MSEPPVTPIPTTGLFSEYRDTATAFETNSPTPNDRDSNDDIYDSDNDNVAEVEDEEEGGNCRDYHEENMMVELLERRRNLYARYNSLDPSRVRISYAPPLFVNPNGSPIEDVEGVVAGMGVGRSSARSTGAALYRRRRGRLSSKSAAYERDNYNNCENTRNNPTTYITTKLWSWVRGAFHGLRLRLDYNPPEETTVAATAHLYHQFHDFVDKFTIFFYNNKAAIIKWILIYLLMYVITAVLPCLLRDALSTFGASSSSSSSSSFWPSTSVLRLCTRLNIPWRTPVAVVVVGTDERIELRGSGETTKGRGASAGARNEGSWRSSLRTRWAHTWNPSVIHLPTHFFPTQDKHHHQPLANIAVPQSPTDGPNSTYNSNTDLRIECDSLSQRVTSLEQSLSNRNIDSRLIHEQLIHEQLRQDRWIEDKILDAIRNELPVELVLVKDPTSGKVQIPEAFWDGIKDILVTRSHLSEVVQKELRRSAAEGRWEDFLAENESKFKCLISDTSSKLSQGAIFSRDEFLYLVATESNAIWTSIEGRVDSLVQRQLAQWMEDEFDGGGGDGPQGTVSRIKQEVLTDMIDRVIERYHNTRQRHSRDGRHSNSVPSYNAQQQQPDYALYNSGGRIIPALTTQPYHRYKPTTIFGRLLGLQRWVPPPFKIEQLMAANKVIQPDMNPGDCWPMHGGWGQISIDLAMRVVVTEVVIEHVDPNVSLHRGTAPKEIEIWRLAAPITSSSYASAQSMEKDKGETPILGTWHKSGSPIPGASLLTTITYQQLQQQQQRTDDGEAETEIELETAQRFAIPLSKQNVPAYGVVVRVLSNWGHPEFTCLYRIRVHGRPVFD